MEYKIKELPGVTYANVSFATKQLRLSAADHEALLPEIQKICTSIESDVVVVPRDRRPKLGGKSRVYLVQNLDCANCGAKIERALNAMPEIDEATLTFTTKKLRVSAKNYNGLLEKMQAAGQPWAVSSLAQAAGLAALDETAYVARVQTLIAQQRPVLRDGLRTLGLRVLDGSANYLLFQAPETLGDALRQRGIVLRSCGNYPGLDGSWYRTAVRTAPENQQLLKALQEVLA